MNYDIIIIGFGVSGIAMAKQCKVHKKNFIVLDKNKNLGGCWWDSAYETAYLNSPFSMYSFSDMRPSDYDYSFPNRRHILKYLKNYCNKWNLLHHVKFNTSVIQCKHYNNLWKVYTQSEDGISKIYQSSHVCICTGFYHKPTQNPQMKSNNFEGKIYMPADFSYQTDINPNVFKNKKVVVIGNGPSGVDTALLAHNYNAKSVTVLFRSHRWFLKRDIDYSVFVTRIFITIVVFIIKCSKTLFIYILKFLFKIYYFLHGYDKYFKTDINELWSRGTFVVSDVFLERVKHNKIKYIHSEVTEFYKNGVITKNGDRYDADIVVQSIGYKQDLSFIGLNKIPYLYKHIIHPKIKNCGFIGFAPSFDWVRVSESQANWYIHYIMGNILPKTSAKMYHDIFEYYSKKRKYILDYHELSYYSLNYIDSLNEESSKVKQNKIDFNFWFNIPKYSYHT